MRENGLPINRKCFLEVAGYLHLSLKKAYNAQCTVYTISSEYFMKEKTKKKS
jgi:hypothetical protein